MGSWKNKVVATEVLEERAKLDFDQTDLKNTVIFDPDYLEVYENARKDKVNHPAIRNTHKYYEMSPEEKQLFYMKKLNYMWTKMPERRQIYFKSHPNL